MAACEVTVSGDTGTVLIKYELPSGNHSMNGLIGDTLYIDDVAANVTYSSIDGNAIAESECVTITNLPSSNYLFVWESLGTTNAKANGMVFNAINIGEATYTFDAADYTKNNAWTDLALNIANMGNENVIPRSGKQTISGRSTALEYIIITVIGDGTPELVLENPYSELNMYIKGVGGQDAVPSGYTEFNFVESDL